MALEVGVLGPIEARREGEELTLGGPQQRRLLGVLVAAAGQVVPVDRLVEAMWPDDPPAGARRSVLTYVSRLRLALSDRSLVTQDPATGSMWPATGSTPPGSRGWSPRPGPSRRPTR